MICLEDPNQSPQTHFMVIFVMYDLRHPCCAFTSFDLEEGPTMPVPEFKLPDDSPYWLYNSYFARYDAGTT